MYREVGSAGIRSFILGRAGHSPTELTTEAAVTLEPEGQGFKIGKSALKLRARVPSLDAESFARMAADAKLV